MSEASARECLTGERTLPGIWHENYWFRRHEVVYRYLDRLLTRSATVLDAGCGEGYGAELLGTGGARRIAGIDYDSSTVKHLAQAYPGVAAVRGNLVGLPFADDCLDAVVSLQVVEHIWEQARYVAECVRVLRPGGLLALSTPNRLTFSPGLGRGEKPLNPFHVNELDPEELVRLVTSARLDAIQLLGVRHGPRIRAWEAAHGSVVAAQLDQPPEHWNDDLSTLVAGLTVDDFDVGPEDIEGCLDLVVVSAVRAQP